MSSFSIIDDEKEPKKYRVISVPIFAIPKGGTGWNKFFKPKAFSINNTFNKSVLFTGHLSGFLNFNRLVSDSYQNTRVVVKIVFNLNGKTNYIYKRIVFSLVDRWTIPINFVQKFTEFGLYDVFIYINGPPSFTSESEDFLYLNATFYHNNAIEDFSTPAYYDPTNSAIVYDSL